MQNNGSVMNQLHKISGKIAEAARPGVPEEIHPETVPENPWEEEPVPSPPREQPAAPPAAAAPKSILQDALIRRYDDYLRSRRDLADRIAQKLGDLRRESETLRDRLAETDRLCDGLDRHLHDIMENDPGFDPGDQIRLAAECRKIEHIRLELFRSISGEAEAGGTDGNRAPASGYTAGHTNLFADMDSLTFGQLCRLGFALLFPLLAGLILAALLIAVGFLLSFSGVLL